MTTLFWGCAGLVVYTYALYPIGLVLAHALVSLRHNHRYLARGGERRASDVGDANLPSISLLVAAYNEQDVIAAKIANSLALDYPADRFELLVGSDGCTDRTEEIVSACADPRVRLAAAQRAGKASVLNRLADRARGEVLVFSDANTVIEPGALRKLARHFGRGPGAEAGLVCGRLRLYNPSRETYEESAYWKYENVVKFYESRFGLVMGANGGLYAMPRVLWRPLAAGTVVDDFVVAMRVLASGRPVRYDPEAVAHEETTEDYRREFKRRARIAAGNFQSLGVVPSLLSPAAGWAALAFWSHKVLRWLVPVFMIGALVSNATLVGRGPYTALLALQLAFYGLACAGYLGAGGRLGRATSTARYFVSMNAALLVGLWRFARGTQRAAWERTR